MKSETPTPGFALMAGDRGLRATPRVAKPSQPKAAREPLPRYPSGVGNSKIH
jgi:hypothetical protein